MTWSQLIYLYLMHCIHFFFSNSVQKERCTCSWQTLSNGNGILEQFPARKKTETVVHFCRNSLMHGQFSCFYFSDWNKLTVNRKCIKKFKVFLIRSLCKDIKFSWVFYTIFGGMVSCFFTMLKEKKKHITSGIKIKNFQ